MVRGCRGTRSSPRNARARTTHSIAIAASHGRSISAAKRANDRPLALKASRLVRFETGSSSDALLARWVHAYTCGRGLKRSRAAVENTTGVSRTIVASRLSTAVVPAATTNTIPSSRRGRARAPGRHRRPEVGEQPGPAAAVREHEQRGGEADRRPEVLERVARAAGGDRAGEHQQRGAARRDRPVRHPLPPCHGGRQDGDERGEGKSGAHPDRDGVTHARARRDLRRDPADGRHPRPDDHRRAHDLQPAVGVFLGRPGVFALGGGIEVPPGPQLEDPGRFVPGGERHAHPRRRDRQPGLRDRQPAGRAGLRRYRVRVRARRGRRDRELGQPRDRRFLDLRQPRRRAVRAGGRSPPTPRAVASRALRGR